MTALKVIAVLIIGYALGNFSPGYIISKLDGGIDIREHGSGGTGTTNVLRTLGWLPSLLTFAGDVVKSLLAALIGRLIFGDIGLVLGGGAAIIGHNWPALFGFRGGKGVASTLGVILAISPLIGLVLLLMEIIIVALTGYMSVASMFNGVLYPVLSIIFYRGRNSYVAYVLFAVFAGGLLIFNHRANIKRLISGTENRLDFKKIKKY